MFEMPRIRRHDGKVVNGSARGNCSILKTGGGFF